MGIVFKIWKDNSLIFSHHISYQELQYAIFLFIVFFQQLEEQDARKNKKLCTKYAAQKGARRQNSAHFRRFCPLENSPFFLTMTAEIKDF